MYSTSMSLVWLFDRMNGKAEVIVPCGGGGGQPDLFGETGKNDGHIPAVNELDIAIVAMIRQDAAVDFSILPENARRLYELSVDAFDAVVHAWMSELPVINETIRFGRKIFAAADNAAANVAASAAASKAAGASACQKHDSRRELIETAERQAAEQAATDRGDPDALAVRAAAYKVWHEINRLMGLLRFCPDENGVYVARCEPDHFILPALGPHFRGRFGETPWAVIDEKRRLCLRGAGGGLELFGVNEGLSEDLSTEKPQNGEWENLWRNYHKAINNESRNNPDLQRRFMPKRYWKYLTEV